MLLARVNVYIIHTQSQNVLIFRNHNICDVHWLNIWWRKLYNHPNVVHARYVCVTWMIGLWPCRALRIEDFMPYGWDFVFQSRVCLFVESRYIGHILMFDYIC